VVVTVKNGNIRPKPHRAGTPPITQRGDLNSRPPVHKTRLPPAVVLSASFRIPEVRFAAWAREATATFLNYDL
jgi:hypothetical protein